MPIVDQSVPADYDWAIASTLAEVAGMSLTGVVGALYSEFGLPFSREESDQLTRIIADIGPRLRIGEADCLALSDRLALSDTQRLLLFNAAIRVQHSNTGWLHYSAMVLLDAMLSAGIDSARTPALAHAVAVLILHGGNYDSTPFTRYVIAKAFLPVFPREAISQAIESMLLGFVDAGQLIQAAGDTLGLPLPVQINFPGIVNLAASLGLPKAASWTRSVSQTCAEGVEVRGAVPAETIAIAAPEGDSHHYAFAWADKPRVLPAIGVIAVSGGTISFDVSRRGRTEFYVFDRNGVLIYDLSHGLAPFIEDPVQCPGTIGILSDRFAGPMNLCHLLLDHLPRARLFSMAGFATDYLLIADTHDRFTEVVNLGGLQDKVIFGPRARFSMRAELLLLPTNSTTDFVHPGHKCASWTLDWLGAAFSLAQRPVDAIIENRLYIDRGDARRRIINSHEVEAILAKHGFKSIRPETMDFAAQAAIFATAAIVVGVHGAGLTNILFSPPGCVVVEIVPALYATDAYWCLARRRGQRYAALIASDPALPVPDYRNWQHNAELNSRDCIVDPEKLDRLLLSLLGDQQLNPIEEYY